MPSKSQPSEPARELLDVVPVVMREIRSQMRSGASKVLTVPQFRALSFVSRNSGSPLSDLAAHIGLTLPSTSRLVDGLITRGLMTREEQPLDRRRVRLAVTKHGRSILNASRAGTLSYLSGKMNEIGDVDRLTVVRAMEVLRKVFPPKSAQAGTGEIRQSSSKRRE